MHEVRTPVEIEMRLTLATLLTFGSAALSWTAAQTAADQHFTTVSGQEVRLGSYAVFKRDCSGGTAAEVRPTGDQHGGILVLTSGTLSTTRIPNCGKVDAPARILSYRPNPGFTGVDQIRFNVVDTATGQIADPCRRGHSDAVKASRSCPISCLQVDPDIQPRRSAKRPLNVKGPTCWISWSMLTQISPSHS